MKSVIFICLFPCFLFAGDTIFIGEGNVLSYIVKDTMNKPNDFVKIDSVKDSSKCIFIHHRFEKDKEGNLMTVLTIESLLQNPVKFDAYLFGFKNRQWIYTSTCPLLYKIASYESWPHKIDSIMFTNFRYMPSSVGNKSGQLECK